MNGVNDYDNFDGPTSAYVDLRKLTEILLNINSCISR